jgi:L,D-transpeptidase ErfK/SrfK
MNTRLRNFPRAAALFLLIGLDAGLAASEPVAADSPSDLIGQSSAYMTVVDDTLTKVAADQGLGLKALIAANPGVDPWLPGAGDRLVLPTAHLVPNGPHEGIVINLPEQRLYQFLGDGTVRSFPVAMGAGPCELAPGETTVKRRRRLPSWRPSARVRSLRPDLPAIVPPGDRNPLGKYAVDLDLPAAIIHGADRPFSDRPEKTFGCIRLYRDHMNTLYGTVRKGTPVTVIARPIKFGWSKGELYLEVHPGGDQLNDLSGRRRSKRTAPTDLDERLADAAGADGDRVDQALVRRIVRERTGVPIKITRPRPKAKVKKVRGLFGGAP